MKKQIICLFLSATVLCGCGRAANNTVTEPATTTLSTVEEITKTTEAETTETETTEAKIPEVKYAEDVDAENALIYSPIDYRADSTRGEVEPSFTEEQWMDAEGNLLFPYRGKEPASRYILDRLTLLRMPESVLYSANSRDLLAVIRDYMFEFRLGTFPIHQHVSMFVKNIMWECDAANELFKRADMVPVVYEEYMESDYTKIPHDDSYEYINGFSIVFMEEAYLASNVGFQQMSDEQKEKIARKAYDNVVQASKEGYFGGVYTSAFYRCIFDEQDAYGSLWYAYLSNCGNSDYEELLKKKDEPLAFWEPACFFN